MRSARNRAAPGKELGQVQSERRHTGPGLPSPRVQELGASPVSQSTTSAAAASALAIQLQTTIGNRATTALMRRPQLLSAPSGTTLHTGTTPNAGRGVVQRVETNTTSKARKAGHRKLETQKASQRKLEAWVGLLRNAAPQRSETDLQTLASEWIKRGLSMATLQPLVKEKDLTQADILTLRSLHARPSGFQMELAKAVVGPPPVVAHRLVDLARAVPNLQASDVIELARLPATFDASSLAVLGRAVSGGAPVSLVVRLHAAVPSLSAGEIASLAELHAKRSADDLETLGRARQALSLPLDRLLALARDVATLSADNAVTLCGLHATRDTAYLATVGKALTGPLPAGRTVADLVTVVNSEPTLAASDVVPIMEVPDAFAVADIEHIVKQYYTGGVTGAQLRDAMALLVPSITVLEARAVADAIVADGATGLQLCETVEHLGALGLPGPDIAKKIEAMRGSLDLAPHDITAVGGNRVLTGPMLHEQVTAKITGIRPVPDIGAATAQLSTYPTGLDPTTRTEDQLWEDCRIDLTLSHPDGTAESPAEKLIRQRLALQRLTKLGGGIDPKIVQQVFQYDEGARPRPVKAPGDEDLLGAGAGAHTVGRHVLGGGGPINTKVDLAERAVFNAVAPCPRKCGAFASVGAAKAAMQAALNQHIGVDKNTASWKAMRSNIIRRQPAGLPNNIAVGGVVGTVMTANHGHGAAGGLYDFNHPNPMRPQAHDVARGGVGGRPMCAADTTFGSRMTNYRRLYNGVRYVGWQGHHGWNWSQWNGYYVPYEPGTPLAHTNNAPTGAYLRILGADVDGGWFIHSAWPT